MTTGRINQVSNVSPQSRTARACSPKRQNQQLTGLITMANFSRSEIDEKPKSTFTQPTKEEKPTLPYGLAKIEQCYDLAFLRCATRFNLRCSSFAGIRFA